DADPHRQDRRPPPGAGTRDAHQFLPPARARAGAQRHRLAAYSRAFLPCARSVRTHEACEIALRSLRISQVGLRGVVGTGLTAAHVIDFASAFGTSLDSPGAVLVGRDPRAGGVMSREGVISALLACGRDAIDLGIAPTP